MPWSFSTAFLHMSCILKSLGTSVKRLLGHKMIWDLTGHVYFNKFPGEVKIYPKAVIFVADNFKTDYLITKITRYFHDPYSSSDMHQSITRLGCQAMGKSPFFIKAF